MVPLSRYGVPTPLLLGPALSLIGRGSVILSRGVASNLSFSFLRLILHCILSVQYKTKTDSLISRHFQKKFSILSFLVWAGKNRWAHGKTR
jgi:hypothetical protein